MDWSSLIFGFLAVAAATALAVGIVRALLLRNAVLDHPNDRSSHSVPTPRGGGIGVLVIALPVWLAIGLNVPASLAGPAVTAWAVAGGALFLALVSWIDDLRSLGALWMLLAFAPVANIAFPIGTIFAERLLYLPSLGFCFVFAVALNQAWNAGRRRLSLAIFVVLVLGLTNRTWMRNADWRDNETLFHAAIHTYPQSAKAHAGLGQALLDRGDTIGALNSLERALSIYPDYAAAHYNTGVAYLALRQW